jgi:hypothetical protein
LTGTPVTVLMTVRNGQPYVREAVRSVLDQTFSNLRLLVLDNASSDGSRDDVLSFDDDRVELVALESDLGQTGALNRGLQMIESPLVARMDADDICLPDRIARQVAEMDRSGADVAVVGSAVRLISDEGKTEGLWSGELRGRGDFLFSLLANTVPLYHPAVMFRRDAINEVGGYDPEFAPAEDFHLWVKLALAGRSVRVVKEPLLLLRRHEGQTSNRATATQDSNVALARTELMQGLGIAEPTPEISAFFDFDTGVFDSLGVEGAASRLVACLDRVVQAAPAATGMSRGEARRFELAVRQRAAALALLGALMASAPGATRALYDFAMAGGPRMFTRLDALLYPLARLPGPLRKSASGIKVLASAARSAAQTVTGSAASV